jgi:hypothetical protein
MSFAFHQPQISLFCCSISPVAAPEGSIHAVRIVLFRIMKSNIIF